MKIYAISDLHLSFGNNKPMDIFGGNWENYLEKIKTDWENKVCEDDIVLISGDISWAMKLQDTNLDFEFLNSLKGKKVLIRGNHDYWWNSISAIRKILPKNIFAIQNDAIKFENTIICGTRGWTIPEENEQFDEHNKKILNREIIRLELALKSAKNLKKSGDEIICMIHYPPFNSQHTPNEMTALFEKYNVSKVIYGHLHGKKRKDLVNNINNVNYYLTSCDQINNQLVLIKN